MRSITDIVYSTYNNEISQNSQNVVEVSRIERYLIPRYFLYSKTFGFIKKILKFRIFNFGGTLIIFLKF